MCRALAEFGLEYKINISRGFAYCTFKTLFLLFFLFIWWHQWVAVFNESKTCQKYDPLIILHSCTVQLLMLYLVLWDKKKVLCATRYLTNKLMQIILHRRICHTCLLMFQTFMNKIKLNFILFCRLLNIHIWNKLKVQFI